MLELDDRKMLDEIKAGVLGKKRPEHRIGRFRVLQRLGQGSMGVVFAGMDDQLRRGVALKLLHGAVGASESERKARLLREAQVLAKLEHPNLVQVHEVGEHDGRLYMAMELVDGRTLDDFQRGRGWTALLPLYIAAGRGLAAAHAESVVHRDFKPHNVLVDQKGEVRVVDFGLARESAGDEPRTAENLGLHEGAIERPHVDLTATGVVPGTPAYMAPELFGGRSASPASDQFSFCVALYEAVYGRRPFAGSCLPDVIAAAKDGQILPPPPDRSVPRWLFEVLERGLAARPERRYPSMRALLAELERDRARPWKQAGMASVAALVIGGAWQLGGHSEPAFDSVVLPDRTAELERRSECGARAAKLEAHWQDARRGLPRAAGAGADADGLASVLDADAARFVQRWEGSCIADVEGTLESCRVQAELAFATVTSEKRRRSLHEDSFHAITYDLELCVEGGFVGKCGGTVLGSPAVAALDEAHAAELAGDLDGALGHAERSIGLADAAGEELTRLRAMLRKGAIHETRGDLEVARSVLGDVVFDALVCGADVLAFDAAVELAEGEILHFGQLEPARKSLARAEKLLDQPGMSALPLRRALLLERWGAAEFSLEHDCIAALPLLHQALELRNEVITQRRSEGLPTAHIARLAADTELNLASIGYYRRSEASKRCPPDGSSDTDLVAAYRAARDRFAATVDDARHLELAVYEFNLGAMLLEIGDFAGAIASFESALSIYLAHYAPESPMVGDAHRALAAAYGAAGKLVRARQHAEADVAIRLLHDGGDGQRLTLAQAHDTLGLILLEQDAYDEAHDALRRAIATLADRPRARLELNELEQLYMSELNLALIEHTRGEREAVKRAADQARATQRAIEIHTGETYEAFALHRLVEAWILLDDGEPRKALARLVGAEELRGLDATLEQFIADARQRANSELLSRSSPQPENRDP